MLTILLILGLMTFVVVLTLLVLGAIAISPLILVILLFPLLDILVIGAMIRSMHKKK